MQKRTTNCIEVDPVATIVAIASKISVLKYTRDTKSFIGDQIYLCIKVYKRHEKLYRRPDLSWIGASDGQLDKALPGQLSR